MNPYKYIEGMYGPEMMEQYMARQLGDLPPHIYAIANEVYDSMWRMAENQCVLIRCAGLTICTASLRFPCLKQCSMPLALFPPSPPLPSPPPFTSPSLHLPLPSPPSLHLPPSPPPPFLSLLHLPLPSPPPPFTSPSLFFFSGESGAGKTESTKFIISFLSAMSQRSMSSAGRLAAEGDTSVEEAIVLSR